MGTIVTRTFTDYFVNFFLWNKKFPLDAKVQFNPVIKKILYESNNLEKDLKSYKKMADEMFRMAEKEKIPPREIFNDTRYILKFPKLKGAFLETFLGYEKI